MSDIVKQLRDLIGYPVATMRFDAADLIERQREALRVARDDMQDALTAIEAWASYASEYFKDKHGLEEDVSKTRSAIATIDAALKEEKE